MEDFRPMTEVGRNREATSDSARPELAREAKRLRLERGLSLHRLSALTGYSRPHVREVEHPDKRVPSATVVAAIDKALDAGGRLSWLRERAHAEQQRRREEERARTAQEGYDDSATLAVVPRSDPLPIFTDLAVRLLEGTTYSEANDMQRRTLLLGLGGTALALEAARHGLAASTAEDRAAMTVDEWQEIVSDHGYTYQTASPRDLLESLTIDVVAVQYAISREPDEASLCELRRIGGLLAAFMAMTVANIGRTREARRWWRTARRVVEESGDAETSLWIRGREIVRAPYEQCPLPAVLHLVEQAESRVAHESTRSPLPQLFAGKAQALALAGHGTAAIAALEQARDSFADLPAQTADDHDSLFGWAEERLRFTETFVFSHLGDVERAEEARQQALALYPASYPRGPAQVDLLSAFCIVRDGDVTNGARQALDTMTSLPTEHHVRPVVDLGQKVLDAVPAEERHRAGVAELAEYFRPPRGNDGR